MKNLFKYLFNVSKRVENFTVIKQKHIYCLKLLIIQ